MDPHVHLRPPPPPPPRGSVLSADLALFDTLKEFLKLLCNHSATYRRRETRRLMPLTQPKGLGMDVVFGTLVRRLN